MNQNQVDLIEPIEDSFTGGLEEFYQYVEEYDRWLDSLSIDEEVYNLECTD